MSEKTEQGMDLSIPMTIADLIAARGQIIQSWKDCNAAIKAVNSAFARIHDKDFSFLDHDRGGQRFEKRQDEIDVKEQTHILDYSLYVFALGKLNITNAMTEKAKDDFLEKIKKAKTVFDERQLIGLSQNAEKMFRDSSLNTVRDVFRQLIGIGYRAPAATRLDRKKDNLQKVEKVFRVGWSDVGLSSFGGYIEDAGWRRSSASGHFRFNDLLTACRLIDGDGIPDYSNNLSCILRSAPKSKTADIGYFTIQAYMNGNVKVNWNEDKIHVLEKLNAIGSGRENAMPDTKRKRYKSEHFQDGGAPDPFTYFAPDPKMVPSDEKDFAFYPTMPKVVDRMVILAELPTDSAFTILDPSAGDGAILRCIPDPHGFHGVEFNHHRAEKLMKAFPSSGIFEADFLLWNPPQLYARILMNPPFNDRIEAVHTVKAFTHLRPGGILVGIVPEGWFYRDDAKASVFRNFLQKYEHKPSEKLPAGTFGRTKIETRIVILRKPPENAGKAI